MYHCLAYVHENMKLEAQRKTIVEMIMICCTTEGNDQTATRIRIVEFQCLARLANLHYEHLEDSISLIAHVTTKTTLFLSFFVVDTLIILLTCCLFCFVFENLFFMETKIPVFQKLNQTKIL